jgi:hypothetical protein
VDSNVPYTPLGIRSFFFFPLLNDRIYSLWTSEFLIGEREEFNTRECSKKAASGVLAILPCSRIPYTLRPPKWLRPCWTDFFEHSLQLMMAVSSWACICHGSEIFNSPYQDLFIA